MSESERGKERKSERERKRERKRERESEREREREREMEDQIALPVFASPQLLVCQTLTSHSLVEHWGGAGRHKSSHCCSCHTHMHAHTHTPLKGLSLSPLVVLKIGRLILMPMHQY